MKAREVIGLLEDAGWYQVRQNGSHKIFKHDVVNDTIVVPDHGRKDLAKGTLNSIMKKAGLQHHLKK